MNGVTFATGKVGLAFSFDGADDYVNVPDSVSLDSITSEITVEAWINPQATAPGSGWVFARRNPFISEGFAISVENDGTLGVTVRTTSSPTVSGSTFITSPGVVTIGQFQHIAASASTQTGLVEAFVNGQSVPMTAVFGPATLTGFLSNVNQLFIGRRQSSATSEGAGGGAHYAGLIDELSLYNRALSAAEIQAIFNCYNQPPVITCHDPVILWSPNHELVDASSAFSVDDPDGDPVDVWVRVFSNETEIPDTGDGTGRHAPDFKTVLVSGAQGLFLRSERRGTEDGRFYLGLITADDGLGGVTEQLCILAVCPHDQSSPASLDSVLNQAAAAAGAVDFPAGLSEHGLSAPLGPHQ